MNKDDQKAWRIKKNILFNRIFFLKNKNHIREFGRKTEILGLLEVWVKWNTLLTFTTVNYIWMLVEVDVYWLKKNVTRTLDFHIFDEIISELEKWYKEKFEYTHIGLSFWIEVNEPVILIFLFDNCEGIEFTTMHL